MYASVNDSHAGPRSGTGSALTQASKAAKFGVVSAAGNSKGRARKVRTPGAGGRPEIGRVVGDVISLKDAEEMPKRRAAVPLTPGSGGYPLAPARGIAGGVRVVPNWPQRS